MTEKSPELGGEVAARKREAGVALGVKEPYPRFCHRRSQLALLMLEGRNDSTELKYCLGLASPCVTMEGMDGG